MDNKSEFQSQYTKNLESVLVEISTSKGLLNGQMLLMEELDEKWDEMAKEYMADAIVEIADYPTVAVAWAGYLGMGVAMLWDGDWAQYSVKKDLYMSFTSPRGFDCMDEYVLEDVLSLELNSKEAKEIEDIMRTLSQKVISMMRKENIEPQTPEAFYIFADSVKIMFQIGVSICLTKLGYKYEKVKVEL